MVVAVYLFCPAVSQFVDKSKRRRPFSGRGGTVQQDDISSLHDLLQREVEYVPEKDLYMMAEKYLFCKVMERKNW